MSCKLNRWALAALLAVATVAAACGGGSGEEAAAQAALDEQWTQLQQQKQDLDALRQQLAEAKAGAMAEDGETAAGEGEGEAEGTATDVDALQAQVDAKTDEFNGALVGYINLNPMLEGEPPTERQQAALRMKSGEDILVAEEFIDKGGDYKRALDILSAAQLVDPDNPDLQAAKESAEDRRYMSEERFAQAKKGMTMEEVRGLLGTPYRANVRSYDKEGVEAWFYPVNAGGSAAAVYFRQTGGVFKAYDLKYDAVVKDGPTEVGG